MLTREAAYAVVHDRIVEPWFATFAGRRWRCKYLNESVDIMRGALDCAACMHCSCPSPWLVHALYIRGPYDLRVVQYWLAGVRLQIILICCSCSAQVITRSRAPTLQIVSAPALTLLQA